jgi:hypothetical protein
MRLDTGDRDYYWHIYLVHSVFVNEVRKTSHGYITNSSATEKIVHPCVY